MTNEKETLLMIKGAITDLDAATREKTMDAYRQIVAMQTTLGPDAVAIAVALYGAELAAQ